MLAAAALAVVVLAVVGLVRRDHSVHHRAVDLTPYQGLGMWVDVFDYVPAYQGPGQPVPVPVSALADMKARGVTTVYLQAARDDERARGLIDPTLLDAWVERAHDEGIDIVAWYLPKLTDVDGDLDKLLQLHRFTTSRGDTFDGLAVDIEENRTVPDVEERNRRLVDLSKRLRKAVGDDVALAANPVPPVQLDVVNPSYWPDFPWRKLRDQYDVWLPMTYWTLRTGEWRDAEHYVTENVRLLRDHLHDPEARVHPIGGVADKATVADVEGYVRALQATGSLGGSMYDWRTMTEPLWAPLASGVPGRA